MHTCKNAWNIGRLAGAVILSALLVYTYAVDRTEPGVSRHTPLLLLIPLWLVMATFSITRAPAAGPGPRELFFAVVAVFAGLTSFGLALRDVDAGRTEMFAGMVLLVAGVAAAVRLLASGKYRAGCVPFAFFMIAILCLIWASAQPGIWPFVFIPVVLFIGSLGNLAQEASAQRSMQDDSDRATWIEGELAAGRPTEHFFLFLRPFYVTAAIGASNPRKSTFVLRPAYYVRDVVDWETLFAEQVERFGRFVALGNRAGVVGAGRIVTSDRDWQKKFIRLATFADAIFIIPSNRAGTRFEIEWLRGHGWLHKCIFVWPAMFDHIAARHGENARDILERVGAADVAKRCADGGALYTLGSDERVDQLIEPLPIHKPQRVANALSHILTFARTDGFVDFERSLHLCQSWIDSIPPLPEDETTEGVMGPDAEPEAEITGLTCVECGRVLNDGMVCAFCEARYDGATRWST